MDELTPKQRAFADNYIACGNAAEAARMAGYSTRTARAVGAENLTKPNILEYIGARQAQIDSEKISTLKEIQEMRTAIARGEMRDCKGLAPDPEVRLRAMDSLEKALRIKEEQEEKRRAAEEALRQKTYHMDLDNIPDVFHAAIRAIRNRVYLEYVFKGGRGSTKSSTVAMIILELLKNYHDIHALVCRKISNTVKDSVYAKIKWVIGK